MFEKFNRTIYLLGNFRNLPDHNLYILLASNRIPLFEIGRRGKTDGGLPFLSKLKFIVVGGGGGAVEDAKEHRIYEVGSILIICHFLNGIDAKMGPILPRDIAPAYLARNTSTTNADDTECNDFSHRNCSTLLLGIF